MLLKIRILTRCGVAMHPLTSMVGPLKVACVLFRVEVRVVVKLRVCLISCTFPLLLFVIVPTSMGQLTCFVRLLRKLVLRPLLRQLGMMGMFVPLTSVPVVLPRFTVWTVSVDGLTKISFVLLIVLMNLGPLDRKLQFGRTVRVLSLSVVRTTMLLCRQSLWGVVLLTRMVLLVTEIRCVFWLVLEQIVMALIFSPW